MNIKNPKNNLQILANYHPYANSVQTFAGHANVTPELMQAVFDGKEKLTAEEMRGIARLTKCPLGVLLCPRIVTLDKWNHRHKKMMEALDRELYAVWEYGKEGDKRAERLITMDCGPRYQLVNMELDFYGGKPVPYAKYFGIKANFDYVLDDIWINRMKNSRRGLKPADCAGATERAGK